LDKELGSRGQNFVRYTDYCNIYIDSRRAGYRIMVSTTHFIEKN